MLCLIMNDVCMNAVTSIHVRPCIPNWEGITQFIDSIMRLLEKTVNMILLPLQRGDYH